jgi:hypothetical protein
VFRLPPNQYQERLYLLCQQELRESLRHGKFIHNNTIYVPQHTIDIVTTNENIFNFLYADTPYGTVNITQKGRFKQQFVDNGKRLFVICIIEGLSMDFLWSLMNIAGVVDDSLPFEPGVLREHSELASSLTSLPSHQHTVLPPFFTGGIYDCRVPEMSSLPITTHEQLESCSFGEFHSISIDDGFFSFPSAGDTTGKKWWSHRFTMKSIGSEKHSMREVAFLQALQKAKFKHPHLLASYTGFIIEDILYLIADEATSDLEHVFTTTDPESIDREWLLAQLLGLSEALAGIQSVIEGMMTEHI